MTNYEIFLMDVIIEGCFDSDVSIEMLATIDACFVDGESVAYTVELILFMRGL